ncbi:carbon-nitrogen hydrolase family protein [Filomicrobium sp.]|uniref:carbon-nitrogen hydrolase family protein n=1 Tax=Filomicrobium sp. TaxID=2024831 RepID=UPI002587D85D|nr:carbon-nitrogen hydrolase family protein [Filomicrobium sp.]MCV0367883.1 carbon-nitrogen hydrolase family protein [Filomicrobium sp.]
MNSHVLNGRSATSVKVAAANVASVMFDPEAGVAKACKFIAEAGSRGVELLVFPESFIPGFPIWNAFLRPIDGHALFRRFAASSLEVDGPAIAAIAASAAKHGVAVSLGFSEVANYSAGCLWNSTVLINRDGNIVNHHRKLVPTFYEKLTWNRGDGAGLKVVDLGFGKVGGLICGENGNPLARYVLMAQGEQIHCANYPTVWPFRDDPAAPPYDLREAIRIRAAAHCFEAKVYTIVSAGVLDDATVTAICGEDEQSADLLRRSSRPASMIVTPAGTSLAESRDDEEGLVVADLDMSHLTELKQHHDMAGYYNRLDVFSVSLNQTRQAPLLTTQDTRRSRETAEPTTSEDDLIVGRSAQA